MQKQINLWFSFLILLGLTIPAYADFYMDVDISLQYDYKRINTADREATSVMDWQIINAGDYQSDRQIGHVGLYDPNVSKIWGNNFGFSDYEDNFVGLGLGYQDESLELETRLRLYVNTLVRSFNTFTWEQDDWQAEGKLTWQAQIDQGTSPSFDSLAPDFIPSATPLDEHYESLDETYMRLVYQTRFFVQLGLDQYMDQSVLGYEVTDFSATTFSLTDDFLHTTNEAVFSAISLGVMMPYMEESELGFFFGSSNRGSIGHFNGHGNNNQGIDLSQGFCMIGSLNCGSKGSPIMPPRNSSTLFDEEAGYWGGYFRIKEDNLTLKAEYAKFITRTESRIDDGDYATAPNRTPSSEALLLALGLAYEMDFSWVEVRPFVNFNHRNDDLSSYFFSYDSVDSSGAIRPIIGSNIDWESNVNTLNIGSNLDFGLQTYGYWTISALWQTGHHDYRLFANDDSLTRFSSYRQEVKGAHFVYSKGFGQKLTASLGASWFLLEATETDGSKQTEGQLDELGLGARIAYLF